VEPLATSGATGVRAQLARTPSARSRFEGAIRIGLFAAAALSVATTAAIVFSLLEETVQFFRDVPIADYLFGTKWTPLLGGDQQSFGVLPLLAGTVYLTAIGLAVAIPLGLLIAIYLSEYASQRVRRIVKPVLETLAGVPTIVLGYFALTFFTPTVLENVFHAPVETYNMLSAGIILGFLVLPTIASVSEDAMSAVPAALREGAFGLGASKLQVSLRVVFPAALSGVVAALILGASRAVGETVLILIASGQNPQIAFDPFDGNQNMAAFIAATSRGDAPTGSIEYETIFVVGFTLFVATLLLNALSIRFVNRFRQVYE
jgi:phosphate transport system permease protein